MIEPSASASLQKLVSPGSSIRPQAGLPAQTVQLKYRLQNTGTLFLRQLQVTDTDADFFDAVDLTGTVRVNYPPGANRVRVDVCTGACGAGDFVNGATLDNTQTPPLPAGVAPADIRGIRVTFSARPVATPNDPADVYRITPGHQLPHRRRMHAGERLRRRQAARRSPLGARYADAGLLSDTATGGFESRQQVPGTLAPIPASTATHQLTTGTAVLQFSKSPNTTAAPGVPFPFNLRLRNAGTGAVADPVIVEPLPPGIDFSPTDPSSPYRIESVARRRNARSADGGVHTDHRPGDGSGDVAAVGVPRLGPHAGKRRERRVRRGARTRGDRRPGDREPRRRVR